jgi:mRNA interferase RelE/StbE
MAFRIQLERNAEKDLDQLSALVRQRVTEGIRRLAGNPRPRGCAKLQGASDLWRIRVGDYRVIYSIDDDLALIRIGYVRHRKDAYR